MEQKALKLIMAGLLILSMALTGREAAEYVGAMHAVNALRETGMGADDSGRLCVVVDAGHGGDDPGKIGINGAPEKDINLQIAQKLKKYLEAEDVEVVLTRETEDGLYDAHASNKKVQDMKRRIEIIEKTDPVLTVSIHQNSYPEEYVKGAQVFYYGQSQEGKELAEVIQKSLVAELDKENHRTAKANESYYLLKKTKTPTVIVECGFLSNRQEADLLSDAEYQQKVAVAISKGIENYLNEEAKSAKKP